MAAPLSDQGSVQTTGCIHSGGTDDNWPLKLIWAGEDYRQCVREHFEKVLKRSFDSRKGAAVIGIDLLLLVSAAIY